MGTKWQEDRDWISHSISATFTPLGSALS